LNLPISGKKLENVLRINRIGGAGKQRQRGDMREDESLKKTDYSAVIFLRF